MKVTFHDEGSGALRELKPAAPPVIDFFWGRDPAQSGLGALREELAVGSLMDGLVYLGYGFNQNVAPEEGGVDLCFGPAALKPPAGCWLKPGRVEAAEGLDGAALSAKGFEPAVFRLLCLSTHYRRPLRFGWPALAERREELERLRGRGRSLEASHGSSEANAHGLTAYKKRFRDALAADLDLPGALAAVWDGLRPGALSPGSALGLLREADPVLGLDILGAKRP